MTFLLFLVQVTRRKLGRTSPKLWGHRPTYLEGRDACNIINSVTDEVETQNDFTSPCSCDICVNPGTSPLQFCNSISRSDLPEKYQLSGSLISWSRTHYGRPQWSPSMVTLSSLSPWNCDAAKLAKAILELGTLSTTVDLDRFSDLSPKHVTSSTQMFFTSGIVNFG